jgi:DNA-binding CsgD family transcriptional regulator
MQPSAEAFSKLLLSLYAAPTQPEMWSRFLTEFTQLAGLPASAQGAYERWYGQMDAWRPGFPAKREGAVALDDGLCATPETLALMELIVPHVRMALQLRHQLCEAEVAVRNHVDVIERLRAGVVLLNEQGECLFANRKAEHVCAANEGVYLRHSRLGAHKPDDHQVLCRLIERATAAARGQTPKACGSVSIHRPAAPPLTVSVMALSPQAPLMPSVASKSATVAVFIRSADDEGSGLPELLIARYGLTSAEARLAAQLFDGRSLTQAAERNNVSRETVRGQLRSIFSKTQVRRQTHLLRLCAQVVREP